ncbi:MAG TPA: pyridoxal-phosphate dependent enzyme [Thermoanaerobaculia bacterium]|nr:pyridoxal-phosphate dependent enzyme [Thermoanaerobaculia bacterium]
MQPPILAAACTRCGTPYPETGLPDLCPRCGGFWGYPDGLPWSPPAAGAGFRRWAGALGLEPGELPERELGDLEGGGPRSLDGVTVVQEGSWPQGTFKERGAEVVAAVCARRGLPEVFLDSSGNAGLAVAAACAARGIACRVLVPGSTPEEKLARLRATGAAAEVVPGDRQAAAEAARALRGHLPYASHVYQPFFLAGVATLAWELAEALAGGPLAPRGRWEADGPPSPAGGAIERVLLPAGNGSLLLGLALGLDALVAAGRLPRPPALHAVQLAGYASLAPEGPGERAPGPPLAAGIAVADPPRRAEMAAVLARTGGDVTVVTEEEIAGARRELAARGFPTDPTGAAAWSGLQKRPDLPREGTVVILTSRG